MDFVGDFQSKKRMAEALRGRQSRLSKFPTMSSAPIVTQASGAFPGQVGVNWGSALERLGLAFMENRAAEQASAAEQEAASARSQALNQLLGKMEGKPPQFSDMMALQELGLDPGTAKQFLPEAPSMGAMLQAGVPMSTAMKLYRNEPVTPEEMASVDAAMEQFRNAGYQNKLEVQNLKGRAAYDVASLKAANAIDQIWAKADALAATDANRAEIAKNKAELDMALRTANPQTLEALRTQAAQTEDWERVAKITEFMRTSKATTKPESSWITGTIFGKPIQHPSALSPQIFKKQQEFETSAENMLSNVARMKELQGMAADPAIYTNRNALANFLADAAGNDTGMFSSLLNAFSNTLLTKEGALFRDVGLDSVLKDMAMLGGNDSNQELQTIKGRYANLAMNAETVQAMIEELGHWAMTAALSNKIKSQTIASQGASVPGGSAFNYAKKVMAGEVENPVEGFDVTPFRRSKTDKVSDADKAWEELQKELGGAP